VLPRIVDADCAGGVLEVFTVPNGNIKKTLQALSHVQDTLKTDDDKPGGEEEAGGQ